MRVSAKICTLPLQWREHDWEHDARPDPFDGRIATTQSARICKNSLTLRTEDGRLWLRARGLGCRLSGLQSAACAGPRFTRLLLSFGIEDPKP